ncbi:hypothetical protein IH414_17605 [Acinetobacter baumannii]|uniref:hypothetical protein n=2 Tax=Acinetobacter baumannii TaxID=470 RepID=UPI001E3BD482|nr:hypothetical protein [Acinetobacter baumannii]MCD7388202.1 hypothetical protein [Acinetobacter baumannii]
MKPEQFIREFGLGKAREVVEGIPSKYMECYYSTLCYCTKAKKYSDRFNPRIELVNMDDLKRLMESVALVIEHYTVERAKIYANSPYTAPEVKQALERAIVDYESIYGGGESHAN